MIGSYSNGRLKNPYQWKPLYRSITGSWTLTLDISDMLPTQKMKSTNSVMRRRFVLLMREGSGELNTRTINGTRNTICKVLVNSNSETLMCVTLRADYADDDHIQELLQWTNPHVAATEEVEYTEREKLAMIRLPRKECKFRILYISSISHYSQTPDLTTPIQTHYLYLTLVTLLFSFAYESRTTQHDPTPESAWTICNLTPAFSALDPPSSRLPLCSTQVSDPRTFSLEEISTTLVPSYRRALAFPLYRSFGLADTCRTDVSRILLKGKKTVVRCLLEMKDILDHHEVYYVYSKVWVDDFCSWIQSGARLVDSHRTHTLPVIIRYPF